MLKNIFCTLVAGTILTAVGWMSNQASHVRRGVAPDVAEELAIDEDWNRADWNDQTEHLISWVEDYDLQNSALDTLPSDFDIASYLDAMQRPSSVDELEVGLSRIDVRTRLGDPVRTLQEDARWEYRDVTVVFDDDDTVKGWLITADADSILQSMRQVMAPIGGTGTKGDDTPAMRTRPLYVTPPVNTAGRSSSGRGSSRPAAGRLHRSLDNAFDRSNPFSGGNSRSFRRPSFMRNLFDTSNARSRRRN